MCRGSKRCLSVALASFTVIVQSLGERFTRSKPNDFTILLLLQFSLQVCENRLLVSRVSMTIIITTLGTQYSRLILIMLVMLEDGSLLSRNDIFTIVTDDDQRYL